MKSLSQTLKELGHSVKTDPENVKVFFWYYFVSCFGNTAGHNGNQVLTVPINKKQFAELAILVQKREEKWKEGSTLPCSFCWRTIIQLLIVLPGVVQGWCDWSKNRNQVSGALLLCLNHKIILHLKCLPVCSPGESAGWSVIPAVWKRSCPVSTKS